jgi:hypothetical protein
MAAKFVSSISGDYAGSGARRIFVPRVARTLMQINKQNLQR